LKDKLARMRAQEVVSEVDKQERLAQRRKNRTRKRLYDD
jgi:hypothetical protein